MGVAISLVTFVLVLVLPPSGVIFYLIFYPVLFTHRPQPLRLLSTIIIVSVVICGKKKKKPTRIVEIVYVDEDEHL